jgi:hypothetical protein
MLDVTKPTDQEHVAQLPYWIRQTRTALNAIQALDSNIEVTDVALLAGTTGLIIPTHLTVALIEVVTIDSTGISNIATIQNGVHGMIKIFIFKDNNINIVDGLKDTNGNFYLNQLPVGTSLEAAIDDVLAVVNINGDGGATTHGYWKELWRQISVK